MTNEDFWIDLDEELPDDTDFVPVPAGEYKCVVIAAEFKPTKAGDCSVSVQYAIAEGQKHANRRIFQSYLLENANPKAAAIGKRGLQELGLACGLTGKIRDLYTLVDHVVLCTVNIQPGTGGYKDQNRVSSVRPADGKTVSKPASKTASKPAPEGSVREELGIGTDEVPW
jgi:hypothetical protein